MTMVDRVETGGVRAGVVLLGAALLAGCSTPTENGGTPSRGRSSAAVTGTRVAPSQAPGEVSRAAVEAAYRAFWPVVGTFAAQPQSRWRTVLGRVATDPQLSYTIAASQQHLRTGVTVYGQAAPRTPTVRLTGPGRAVLRDCADFSRTGQADKAGRKRTVGVARTPLTVAVLKGSDGRWRVSKVDFTGGTC